MKYIMCFASNVAGGTNANKILHAATQAQEAH